MRITILFKLLDVCDVLNIKLLETFEWYTEKSVMSNYS